MIYLDHNISFPSIEEAFGGKMENEYWASEGLLAVGGDLSAERLLHAYNNGIFPWFEEDQPILWWCPANRMVLFPDKLKVSKSLKKIIKKEQFKVTFNQNFQEVIANCAEVYREGQGGTWITADMQAAYNTLHKSGNAISVEVWQNNELVGGLYGIDLFEKKVFCGESMFSAVSNASKVGFYFLVQFLKEQNYELIDCQIYTDHLHSLGAEEITRKDFLDFLNS